MITYERPLRESLEKPHPILAEDQIDLLFNEIGNIMACHQRFLSLPLLAFMFFEYDTKRNHIDRDPLVLLEDTQLLLQKWSVLSGISHVFVHISPSLTACYEIYASNFSDARAFLASETESNTAFNKFLREASKKFPSDPKKDLPTQILTFSTTLATAAIWISLISWWNPSRDSPSTSRYWISL